MATIQANGVNLYYEESGAGKETIVFSHGFLMNHTMFQAQIEALAPHFRCIAYDQRGHGRSEIPQSGYDIDNLTTDEVEKWKGVITSNDKNGVVPFARGIFHRDSVVDQLGQIQVPTVVIGGEEDIAAPPEKMKQIVAGIPGTTLHLMPNAGHSTVVETPDKVTAVMLDFYKQVGAIAKDSS